jgi:hypothetical protein
VKGQVKSEPAAGVVLTLHRGHGGRGGGHGEFFTEDKKKDEEGWNRRRGYFVKGQVRSDELRDRLEVNPNITQRSRGGRARRFFYRR